MSTWEQRMSERAKARESARVAAKAERLRQLLEPRYTHLVETMPALPGEVRLTLDHWDDDHVGHLTHLCGNSSWCSCGEHLGIFSIAMPDPEDMPPPCEICKARKIGGFRE